MIERAACIVPLVPVPRHTCLAYVQNAALELCGGQAVWGSQLLLQVERYNECYDIFTLEV